jgi:hypothetical protein
MIKKTLIERERERERERHEVLIIFNKFGE